MKNPYAIFGLHNGATLAQAKARYYELAKQHHPDKMTFASPTEKEIHENIFKEITAAYSIIERQYKDKDYSPSEEDYVSPPDDWRTMWKDVEAFLKKPGMWDCMKDIVTATLKDVAIKGITKFANTHNVQVPVTMEEVHMKKVKKVRMFLSNVDDPVFVFVDLSEYPYTELQHTLQSGLEIQINAELVLQPNETYKHDDVLDSWDLFTTVKIDWVEYICGVSKCITYLDGTVITVHIVPFTVYNEPIVYNGYGLCGLGNLYVSVEIVMPENKEKWATISKSNKDAFLDVIQCMY